MNHRIAALSALAVWAGLVAIAAEVANSYYDNLLYEPWLPYAAAAAIVVLPVLLVSARAYAAWATNPLTDGDEYGEDDLTCEEKPSLMRTVCSNPVKYTKRDDGYTPVAQDIVLILQQGLSDLEWGTLQVQLGLLTEEQLRDEVAILANIASKLKLKKFRIVALEGISDMRKPVVYCPVIEVGGKVFHVEHRNGATVAKES